MTYTIVSWTVWFNGTTLSEPCVHTQCFAPRGSDVTPFVASSHRRSYIQSSSSFISTKINFDQSVRGVGDSNPQVDIHEAAVRIVGVAKRGFIESIDETRSTIVNEATQVEKDRYFHCVWEDHGSWNECCSFDFNDLLSQIEMSCLPNQPIKAKTNFLLSPAFVGNLFHEFAHSLEIDHAPQAKRCIGKSVFGDGYGSLISIAENPTRESFGKHTFSDAGVPQHKTVLVQQGILRSCLGDYDTGEQLYTGIGGSGRLSPRTVCLEVEGPLADNWPQYGSVVVGGYISTVLMRPCDLLLWIGKINICNYKDSEIFSNSCVNVDRVIRFRNLLDRISFLPCNILHVPRAEGICQKGGSRIRSTQFANFALLQGSLTSG